jgi:VCBS repeat-containing protein
MQPKDAPKTSKSVATTANNSLAAQDSTHSQIALHPSISIQNPAALLLNTPATATAQKRLAKKATRPAADDTPDSDSMVNSDTSLPAENPNQELVSEVSLNPTWQLAAAETALGTATEASALPGAQAATTAAAATETSALAAVVSTTVPSGVLAAAGVVGVASAAGGSSSSAPTNQAPVVEAALRASAKEGDTSTTINLLSGASDVNNDTLSVSNITYKVGNGSASSTLPSGLSLSGNTLSLDPTSSAFNSLAAGEKQTIVVSYTISDGQGGSVAQTATFTITGTNDSPVAVATSDQTGVINEAISFTASAFTDADSSDTLTYTATLRDGSALPSWLTFDASTRTFSGTPPTGTTAETLSLKVTASDSAHATASTYIDLVLQAEPTIAISGSGTAGTAAAGLLVEAVNSDGTVIASTTTDSTGHYTLNIAASYKDKALVLRVSDPDASDGVGYTDEATGQSKDFGSALRTTLVLSTADEQTAQITPLTELATRKILNGSDTLAAVDTSTITSTNTAISTLFGVKDIVGGSAPTVVSSGSSSDDYGKALALLSGMDAVNDRSGAENAMEATLSKLESAITISGGLSAQFSSADVETLSLLSQGVAEVQTLYSSDTSLIDALTSVAQSAAATAKEDSQTTVFITTKANLIGSGKTTTVTFTFDAEPSEDVLTALSKQLSVIGGTLSNPTQDSTDHTKYTATFTQDTTSSETPQIRVTSADSGYSFFSNDVSITLDNTAPTLSTLQIQGYDSAGVAKTGALTTGDVVRVTLSASESVLVDGTPSLSLLVGTQTVTASYSSTLSSTRNLVFTYTIGSTDNAADGVSVSSISGSSSITDIAGNALDITTLPTASSLPVVIDTTAPSVVSEIPSDGSTVGGTQTLTLSFNEAVQRGTGNIVVKKGDAPIATLDAADTTRVTFDTTGTTVTLTLPSTLNTGDYTVEVASTAFKDSAGNTMRALASSLGSTWNFTVGAVKANIDTISGNNLINATEASNTIAITGSLSGDSTLLSTLSASDLTLTLKPMAGGNTLTVDSSGITLNSDHTSWSYTLPANSLSTAGGYIVNLAVNHTQDGSTVQASASRAVVVDTSTSLTLGKVAGDDIISVLERKVVDSSTSKTIDMALVAEKGATVNVTISTGTGHSVIKTIASAQGSGLDKITLSSADLSTLGSGTATLSATSTDLAGNSTEASKTFLLAGGTAPAIGSMTLSGTPSGESGSYRVGDTLTATVTFDQALTVSGKSATLALDVGGTTRLARYSSISEDGKTLSFSYTVQAGDTDNDGVSVKTSSNTYTPLSLNGSTLRNATGTDASLTLGSITASSATPVDAAASAPALTASATSGNEDTAITLNLSAALSDKDGSETLSSVTLSGIPTGAVLKSGSTTFTVTNGSALVPVASLEGLTLTPPSNYNGSISLTASVTSTEYGGSTATSTKTVTITVNAVNDAPTVQYELTTANAVSGQTLSWSLPSNTFADVDNTSLSYSAKLADGSSLPSWLSINAKTGALTGTPSATDAAVLSVLIQATDAGGLSASSTLSLQVLAANAPQPVADSASATEAGGINNATAAVLASGSVLTNDVGTSLVVSGAKAAGSTSLTTVEASTVTLQGAYGSLTISADGSYTYTPNDSSTAVQALAVGQSLRDVFNYQVKGGDGQTALSTLTITLNGANDAAVISGTSTASLTESNAFQTISGTLTSTDVDGTANLFTAQSGVTGSNGYGSFSITSGGVWKYTMNSAHNEFVAGTTYTDTATVAAADGTTQVLTVTITGTNDAAVISGTKAASLTETNEAQSTGGTLTSTDVDGTANLFTEQSGVLGSNGYGTFSITSGGVWKYTMNSAHNEFVGGKTYADTATVAAADGTTQVLTVTITGTNDAPVLTIAASTRVIDEDLNNTGRYIAHNGSASDLGVVNAVAGLEQISLTDVDTANFGGDVLKVSITSGGTTQLFMGVSNSSGMFSVDSSGYIHYYSDATYDGNTGLNVTPHTASNTSADIVIGAIDSTYKGLHGGALWIHLNDSATPAITQALASKIYLSVRNASDGSVTEDWSGAAGTKTVQFELDDSSGSALASAQRTVSVVSHVDVLSRTVTAGTYGEGSTITVTVTADDAIYVDTTKGIPQYQLSIGGTTKYATYTGGSGTKQLTYSYVVEAGLTDSDGIDVIAPVVSNGAVFSESNGTILGASSSSTLHLSNVLVDTSSSPGTAPLVSFVSLDSTPTSFFTPDDTIYINVGFDQAVVVSGKPKLELTLTDANGTNHTVYATCQTTTGSGGATVLSFAYTYAAADTNNLGGQFHIVGLSPANGSSITSASSSVAADLTLHSVTATADFWLHKDPVLGSTGTSGNDLLGPWVYGDTPAPKSLSGSGVTGGAGDRDTLAVSILLPDTVTTAADAAQYYLSTSPANGTVSLMKAGVAVEGYTYTVPGKASDWPDGVESLVYHLTYKDSHGDVQFANYSAVQLWKSVETFTDAVNPNDIVVQGSYLSDTIDLSSYGSTQRVTVKAGSGNDIITGHSGTDIVLGQGGNDTINTGAGNDKIFLGSGIDTIDGGTGTDTLVIQMHGAQAKAANASATNQSFDLQSANGSWVSGSFVTDASGYTSDYTFSFSETTGKVSVAADSASGLSGSTSSVTGIEQLEIRFTNNNERDNALFTVGTTGDDTLTANGVVWARAGNDTINVVGDSVVFAGDGDDTVILASTDLFDATQSSYLFGGNGIDTLKLSDSAPPTTPSGNWGINTQQFEIFDMTGAGSNTFRFSTSLLLNQGNTVKDIWGSLAGYSGMQQFMAKGDSVDTVSFVNTGWVKADTTTTVNSTVFDIWTYADSSLQVLLQHGIQTTTPVI